MTTACLEFGVNGACVRRGILPFNLSLLILPPLSPSPSVSLYLCARKPHSPQQGHKQAASQGRGTRGRAAIPHGPFSESTAR
jgi:hypothetical protein